MTRKAPPGAPFGLRRWASDPAKLAGMVFKSVGVLAIVGGVLMAFSEPGALFLCLFGAVFFGVGHVAPHLFSAPAGMKAVVMERFSVPMVTDTGVSGTRDGATIEYIRESASEEEVQALRHQWRRARWQEHPDWIAGKIVDEQGSKAHYPVWAAAAGLSFAAVGAVLQFVWDPMLWLVTAVGLAYAGWYGAVWLRQRLVLRRFGASLLELQTCPAFVGEALRGRVRTGVGAATPPEQGFDVELCCVHRFEHKTPMGAGDTRTRSRHDVLWRRSTRVHGQRDAQAVMKLTVPVAFDLDADLLPTTLVKFGGCILWQLGVRASLSGIDYSATFEVPVFTRDTDPRG